MKKVLGILLSVAVLLSALLIPASAYTVELVSRPNKTSFYEGVDWMYSDSKITPKSDFDLTGTVIRYNGSDITFKKYNWGGNMYVTPANNSWKTGLNNVKIYLDDYDDIYVSSTLNLVAIKKIELVKAPNKTELIRTVDWDYDSIGFISLKSYSPTGAQIKVTYTDSTSTTITYGSNSGITWQVPSSLNDFSLGKNNLELVYYGHTVPFEINFVLEKLSSAIIKSRVSKTTYDFGSDWTYSGNSLIPKYDYSGLSVTLSYSNGTTDTVSYNNEPNRFRFQPVGAIKLGSNTIKATIDGKASVEFQITLRGYGDVEVDGLINSFDALSVLQYSVGLLRLGGFRLQYADVTADSTVNSSDALAILQRSVGIINKFKSETV